MRSSVWTIVIVAASMMSCVCVDLGFGGPKSHNRDFESISGIASVYDQSSGKQTANGEQLDENALTAAHRSLPFGTMVRVKNNGNGREALVRINDRGPFVRGRIIDLTPAGAKALGFFWNRGRVAHCSGRVLQLVFRRFFWPRDGPRNVSVRPTLRSHDRQCYQADRLASEARNSCPRACCNRRKGSAKPANRGCSDRN